MTAKKKMIKCLLLKVNIFKEQGNIGAYFFHNIKEYRVKILNDSKYRTIIDDIKSGWKTYKQFTR